MNLPQGVLDRPRQERLIAVDEWAIIRIETGDGRFPLNQDYEINERKFEQAVAPYLHGDWEEFDRIFRISPKRKIFVEGHPRDLDIVYSSAVHVGTPKLPNITVVPNLYTLETRGIARELTVFGSNMGHYHTAGAEGYRIQEVYEFQSHGLIVIDRETGEVEMWVSREGDKVSVPNECHMTLYNLGDTDHPLITLNYSDPDRNPYHKDLIKKCGPILLIYYDDFEVVFTLNHLYINNPNHSAGVRLSASTSNGLSRQIRIKRGARLDLGGFLYEQLTQNPELIGQFALLGIRIRQASPEAILEPLPEGKASRLYFSLPLIDATQRGSDVYRYFKPGTEAAKPERPLFPETVAVETSPPEETPEESAASALNRPLVIVVEGGGGWVGDTYRPLFIKKSEKRRLAVFYADDTRWKPRPSWADPNTGILRPWEVYLDKADPDDFAMYQKLLPDVVFIVTPDFTHSTIARNWLNKVPLVFIEKPFDSQVRNVEQLRLNMEQRSKTEVLGLDHYQFYALPVNDLKPLIDEHLGDMLTEVIFYMTEDRPIEMDREMSLQYGLTLDLLPHMIALLKYFGNLSTIDDIAVVQAGQYKVFKGGSDPGWKLIARSRDGAQEKDLTELFHNETYSRVQFTFQDDSQNGFHVPCTAVVGKGFSQEVKYLQITGVSGNAIRIDLKQKPAAVADTGYPWDSVFFLQGNGQPVFSDAQILEVNDPYQSGNILKILFDPEDDKRPPDKKSFMRPLERSRYEKLMEDLLDGTSKAIQSTLSLVDGQDIVRALDRIWWAIQDDRGSWVDFKLGEQNPFVEVKESQEMQLPATDSDKQLTLLPGRILGASTVSGLSTERTRYLPATRTRGPLQPPEQLASPSDLGKLLAELRAQVGDLPLSIIIYGWRRKFAEDFLNTLARPLRLLQKGDAIWLIRPGNDESAASAADKDGDDMSTTSTLALERAVLLDLTKVKHQRIYENLPADLVFFPGSNPDEVEEAKKFAGRARMAVIDQRGAQAQTLMRTGEEIQLPVVSWHRKNRLEQSVGVAAEAQAAEAADAQELDVEELVRTLKDIAGRLQNELSSRDEFRSSILEVLDAYPGYEMLSAELVRQADAQQWPTWAVECLPKLYIPLETMENGDVRILVWRYIIDCIPASYPPCHITQSLCREQFYEADAPKLTADFLKVIAPSFEKNLQVISHADASEQHVLKAIHEAMLDIERWLEIYAQGDLQQFKEKRKGIQTRIRQPRRPPKPGNESSQ